MSGTIINAKNPSNVYQPLNVDASGRLECSVNEIEITAGDISVAVDGLEGLQQTTIDKIILPTALTGSGNLKVSIQELGNEGSERLNVDVGSTISQLPSALTGSGNLKVSLETMNGSATGISTSAKQDTTNGKLDHLSDNLDTINSSVGNLATENTLNIIAEEFTKCDTDNITITGGLTGSGNLKVCIQELGNEGSERLNVDVGNDITQLPTQLSGSGRLKIENDISGFSTASLQRGGLPSALSSDNLKVSLKETISVPVTHTTLTNLDNAINSNKVDVNISSGNITGFSTASLQGGGLPSALSSDNLKVSLKETISVPITHSTLTNLDNAINSNKVDVNISSGNISGFSTASLQGGGLPSALSSDNLKVSLKETISVPVTHDALTSLDSVIGTDNSTGPAKCISIGGTNLLGGALQEIACDGDGHLQIDILSSALPSGAAGEVSNAATASATGNILTKTTLATSAEVKQLLSSATINAGAQSAELDTENYEKIRFFGITTSSIGTDVVLMGTNVSGGTTYILGENLRSDTIGGVHYVYGADIENLPRYIKLLNKSASNDYVFTKLYLQGSGGRLLV